MPHAEAHEFDWFQARDAHAPKWMRTVAVRRRDSALFVPALLGCSEDCDEERLLTLALKDRTPTLCVQGVPTLVPARWLARRFPDLRNTLRSVQQRISEKRRDPQLHAKSNAPRYQRKAASDQLQQHAPSGEPHEQHGKSTPSAS